MLVLILIISLVYASDCEMLKKGYIISTDICMKGAEECNAVVELYDSSIILKKELTDFRKNVFVYDDTLMSSVIQEFLKENHKCLGDYACQLRVINDIVDKAFNKILNLDASGIRCLNIISSGSFSNYAEVDAI